MDFRDHHLVFLCTEEKGWQKQCCAEYQMCVRVSHIECNFKLSDWSVRLHTLVGAAVGFAVGLAVGRAVGAGVGSLVGAGVGAAVGAAVGAYMTQMTLIDTQAFVLMLVRRRRQVPKVTCSRATKVLRILMQPVHTLVGAAVGACVQHQDQLSASCRIIRGSRD